jgi:hypothetical protein
MGLFSRNKTKTIEQPVPIGAITASGETYRVASYSDSAHLSLLRQEWQVRAYDIYDTQGHLYYATNYIGGALSRIKLVAAKRPKDDGDTSQPEIITSGPIYKAIRAIQSDKGGQSAILRSLGKNVFLTGEAWMIATDVENFGQSWEAVSIEELVSPAGTGQFFRKPLPGAHPIPISNDSLKIRIWKEHPRYSEWADSGVRSCLEILEKIVILNRAEKAIARSRLAGSGILALPQELVPPSWQNQSANPNDMESNPLYQALAESMTAPLADESHPAAVVPLVLIGPKDAVNGIKYEEMSRTFDTKAAQLSIQNGIDQVASTLELPKEILLGTGEATHWSAWAIKEDTFQAHIQPLIELICVALTTTYLRQALKRLTPDVLKRELDKLDVESPDDIMVWYDASELVIRPDKGDKALGLHDRFAISDEALRREAGFGQEDAPSEEEYAKRVGIKMADPKMALTGEPTPPPQPAGGALPPPTGRPRGGGGPLP